MSTPQEIKALEDRRYKAMVEADVPALNELLADDMIYTLCNAVVDSMNLWLKRQNKWQMMAWQSTPIPA